MIALNRFVLPIAPAGIITCILFYLMFLLVKVDQPTLRIKERLYLPPLFVDTNDVPPIINTPKPIEPPMPELQPQPLELDIETQPTDIVAITTIEFNPPKEKDLPTPNDYGLVCVLCFQPNYPSSPLNRGIEGWVRAGFSVDTKGVVFDAHVIESEPGTTFDRAALKAISKFKFQPRVAAGKAVVATNQQYLFRFEISD